MLVYCLSERNCLVATKEMNGLSMQAVMAGSGDLKLCSLVSSSVEYYLHLGLQRGMTSHGVTCEP